MNPLFTAITYFVVGSLVTFFVTTVSTRNALKTIAKESVKYAIDEHLANCPTNEKVRKMEKAMIFLVVRLNGNPQELGLL